MPMFLGLRTAALHRAEAKAAIPIAFAQYYSDLTTYNLHSRARAWPVERAVVEGYERVVWVFKAVNTIAADSAGLPYRLKDGDKTVDDHPMYRVLNKRANPVETASVFRKRLSAQIMLSKRGAFVEYVKTNGGSVKSMHLLPPDRTEIIAATDGTIDHYRLTRKDGSIKNLEPDTVRWFHDGHPLDPYSSTTPLEAAGLSVELDHFARLYNVTFMQNDGRPGGVLAVRDTKSGTGDITPEHMNRMEEKFGKGPTEAGKLSVIAGELSYTDLATRPRDMQYGATSQNSKIEILSAFGISEVVMGHSADQTYANSDAALYNYWTRPIPAHNKILLDGFDEDSEDDLEGYFDTSSVEILDKVEKEKRAEWLGEVNAGLRSPFSYVKAVGREDELEENAYTRALYIPTGRTPLPAKDADREDLGLAVPSDGQGPPPPEGGGQPGQPGLPAGDGGNQDPAAAALNGPAAPAPPAVPAAPVPAALPPGQSAQQPSGAARAALAAITSGKSADAGGARPKVRVEYRIERKSDDSVESTPDLAAADRLEAELAQVLTALADHWTSRAVARMGSPKQRKGTRHWEPEYEADTRVGTKALDAAKAVDQQTWETEAQEQTHPVLLAAAVAAAVILLTDFHEDPPIGVTMADWAAQLVATTVDSVTGLIRRSVRRQADALTADVNRTDQNGAPMADLADLVTQRGKEMVNWAKGLAVQAATATVNGARDDAAREATEHADVSREWVSRRDDKVRPTHDRKTGCDGQVRALDEPFIVGTALLMRPGDPLGPLREVANCRCYLRHRRRSTGRWTIAPAGVKALPRDGDSDGFIYDGTPRQMPAPPRIPVRPTDFPHDQHYTTGYNAAHERMKGETGDAIEQAARDMDDAIAAQPQFDSPASQTLRGARAALTDLHEDAKGGYTDPVSAPVPTPPAVKPERHPDFGKRIGEPFKRAVGTRGDSVVLENVGGRDGAPHERVLWRVERRDGVWGVYPPQEQAPPYFSTGSKREAEQWAIERAHGLADPAEVDQDDVNIKGTVAYKKAYLRGWAAGRRGAGLEAADNRREPNGWYDGYMDASTDRPKWSLMHHASAEEAEAALAASTRR